MSKFDRTAAAPKASADTAQTKKTKKTKNSRLTIELPEELHHQFRLLSTQERVPMNTLLIGAIIGMLENPKELQRNAMRATPSSQ